MRIGHIVLILGILVVGYLVVRNWSKIKGAATSAAGI